MSSAVSSHLGMELGGRWRTESLGGDGWMMAPSPPMNEDVNISSRWEIRVTSGGGGGFAGRVSVASSLSEYSIDESQQNLPPRFLKIMRTWVEIKLRCGAAGKKNEENEKYLRTSCLKTGHWASI